MNCIPCRVIERCWSSVDMLDPRHAGVSFLLEGGRQVEIDDLAECPDCGKDKGPPAWARAPVYFTAKHADERKKIERDWRRAL